MNSYQIDYQFDADSIAKKHEIWRRKQFNIFYGSGRPIFNISEETEHLRFHRSPANARDVNIRTFLYKKPKIVISNIQSE